MPEAKPVPALIDVQGVAELLACSERQVHRLVKARAMPRPVRLGRLVRWPAPAISSWIENGCPPVVTETPITK